VRQIEALGLDGASGTLAIVGAGTLLTLPFGWRGRKVLAASSPIALISMALGRCAFLLYSVGFLYGRVAVIAILFYLTPVWSTLLGRILMGWPITRIRVLVLVLGVTGLGLMLGADGTVPVPQSLGEWLVLTSGVFWAVATIGIRVTSTAGSGESAFVFVAGAFLGSLILAPLLEPMPDLAALSQPWTVLAWVLLTGGFWWAAPMGGLMWAATKLEPARVGILLMAEVFVAAISAAILVGEHLSTAEIVGGTVVLIVGFLEVWPIRKTKRGEPVRP
jgi:drug/metabolite transporter (DMT)-like permease